MATDLPPEDLLQEWQGTRHAIMLAAKLCGTQGPHASVPAANTGSDLGAVLSSIAAPFMKSLTTMAISHVTPSVLLAPSTSSVDCLSPLCLSSPPPAVEDELVVCLKAFASSQGLTAETIEKAGAGLEEFAYTPDIMGEVTVDHLQELTGFAEGHAIALRKFACEWCGKVDAKRACRL